MLRTHCFGAKVAETQELAVGLDLRQPPLESALSVFVGVACQSCAEQIDFSIAFQDFEARVDVMDAVVNRLQLRRFVDDVNGSRYFPAIVKKAGDLELVSIFLAHREIF